MKKYWITIKCKHPTLAWALFLLLPQVIQNLCGINLLLGGPHLLTTVSLFACFLTPVKEGEIYLMEWWSGLKPAIDFLASVFLARITLVIFFFFFFSKETLPAPCEAWII